MARWKVLLVLGVVAAYVAWVEVRLACYAAQADLFDAREEGALGELGKVLQDDLAVRRRLKVEVAAQGS